MKVLVIGGTRFIGRTLVTTLVRTGHKVTLFHRGRSPSPFGKNVTELFGDRHDPESVRRALAGTSFDGVVDVAYDAQHQTGSREVALIAGALGDRRPRYVYVSSVSVYRDAKMGTREESPRGGPPGTYAGAKFEAEERLLEEHRAGRIDLTMVRPCLVYGPWNPLQREAWLWDRILAGRPVILPDDGSTMFHWVSVGDVAWALSHGLTDPAASGEAFNVGEAEPISHEAFVDRLAEVAGREVQKVRVPRARLKELGGQASGTRLYFGQSLDFGESFGEDVSKARNMLGFRPTEARVGWREAFEWYLREGRTKEPDFSFESTVLGSSLG
jgi:nucleoside-diphosphate-sugar epimerase